MHTRTCIYICVCVCISIYADMVARMNVCILHPYTYVHVEYAYLYIDR